MPRHSPNTIQALRLVLFLLAFWVTTTSIAQTAQGFAIGTVATDIPAVMVHRLEPLTNYLALRLNTPIQLRPAPNMGAAIADFGRGKTQIAYLTPVAFLEARERYGAVPVAIPLSDGKPNFRLAVVVPKNSPAQKLSDLIGRTFAFGDEKSLLQRATLEAGGLKLEQFSRYAYLKHFDNVSKAVLNQDFDAGIMKESLARYYAPQGLRIIHTSPPLPTYVIAVSSDFPADQIPILRKALIDLDTGVRSDRDILTALDPAYTGFVPAVDRHFEAMKKLIAPFQTKLP